MQFLVETNVPGVGQPFLADRGFLNQHPEVFEGGDVAGGVLFNVLGARGRPVPVDDLVDLGESFDPMILRTNATGGAQAEQGEPISTHSRCRFGMVSLGSR